MTGNLHGVATGLTVRQVKQNFFDKSRRYLSNADDMNAALLCVYPPSSHEAVKNRESVIHVITLLLLHLLLIV